MTFINTVVQRSKCFHTAVLQCYSEVGLCLLCTLAYTSPCSGLGIDDVIEKVWDARVKWYNIGLKLGISAGTLDAIKDTGFHNPDNCFTAMLKEWLNNGKPPLSWSALAEALRSRTVGFRSLAEQLPNI